ncbi:MAG: Crp/Fnr family transcriptional regulator [Clostridiaceae bacterium]|nr:Crp/Fnr family transcriptional regulator [Clostridiaceae bacterium]
MQKLSQTELLALINKSPLLKTLPDDLILDLLERRDFVISFYTKDSVVMFEGEKCNSLKIILAGALTLDHLEPDGNFLTIDSFYYGCGIGANLIFLKEPYVPVTIMTTKDSILLTCNKEILLDLLGSQREFLQQYLRFAGMHAYRLNEKIKSYSKQTIREKVMQFLEKESKLQNSNCITLLCTKKELAQQFYVNRSSLSRELNKMRKDGLIDFDAKTITLLK